MVWRSAKIVGTKAEIRFRMTHNPNTERKSVGLKSISTVYDGFTPPGITKLSKR